VSKIETVAKYLEYQEQSKIDDLLALLTDDAVMSNPMAGPVTGKAAIGDAIRNRPGAGMFTLDFGEPAEAGEQVRVSASLPPGAPIPSISFTFSFAGEKISRVDIGM
jgi:hypothetical protein